MPTFARMPAFCLARVLLLPSWPASARGAPPSASASFEADPDPQAIARQLQNPVSDQANFQLQGNVDQGLGPRRENQLLGRLELVLPVRVLNDWNVVVQSSVELKSVPAAVAGADRVNGLGDTTLHLLAAPARPGSWIWGLGPVLQLPTETRNRLGSGRFSMGPSAVAEYQGANWTMGLVAHHARSVDGMLTRDDVELTALQPLVSYTAQTGVNVGLTSESTYNWQAPRTQRWTVPLQATLSKVSIVGTTPVNLLIGGSYYVLAPAGGPDWSFRLALAFILPVLRWDPLE